MAERNVIAGLKRLFSTNVVVRKTKDGKLIVKDTDNIQSYNTPTRRDYYSRMYTSGLNTPYGKFENTMAYAAARLSLFRDYDCVAGDTRIPLPDGTEPTILELSKRYTKDDKFYVFSYDLVTNSVKLGEATNIRSKGYRNTITIEFDKGEQLTVTPDHPVLLRNGDYILAGDLVAGDSVMPFYRKDFYKNGYRMIYNFENGWQSEHRIIAEQFQRTLEENEIVHHKDFNKRNNHPSNLHIMDGSEHKRYHIDIINKKIWSKENREKQIVAIRAAVKYRRPFSWNGIREGKNNPFYGKSHTPESANKISEFMKLYHLDKDFTNEKNPNYRKNVSYDSLFDASIELYKTCGKINKKDLSRFVKCDISTITHRTGDWKEFKSKVISSVNHKIKSITNNGAVEVFDITVPEFANFATTECFVHNCMDQDPILSSVLDIYADESTVKSEFGEILTIKSDDSQLSEILHNLFYDILNIEFNLWPWVRNMCKYGDFFLALDISQEYGIFNVIPLSIYATERREGEDPNNPYYTRFKIDVPYNSHIKREYENYEVAHFRLLSDSNFLPYGRSMIEGARKPWKQLSLLEDAMLIHRITRSADKRVFKINVGNLPPQEVENHIQQIINKTKKTPVIDPETGDYNLRYNMMSMLEDFYIPVRDGETATSIDNIGGLTYDSVTDIDYIKNRMLSALKVPKSFIGYDADIAGKSTLAAQDVRFARTIERIQRIVVSELTKIAVVHLYAQGFEDEQLINFSLQLTNPSIVYEQEKVSLWKEKVDLASSIIDTGLFSTTWIYNNVFNLTDEEMERERALVIQDTKDKFRREQISSGEDDPKFMSKDEQEVTPGPGGEEVPAEEPEEIPKKESIDPELRGPGQPEKGSVYGQDSHVRGRDVIGKRSGQKLDRISPERNDTIKHGLSLENKYILDSMKTKRVITEKNEKKNSYMDAEIIEEITDNTDEK